jgi:RND superfamily putative drug exporter
VLGAWLLVLLGGAPLGARFESVITNSPSSFLPGGAESVAAAALAERFPGGELTPAIIAAARDEGLTAADRAAIEAIRSDVAANLPAKALAPTPIVPSENGRAVVFSVPLEVTGDSAALTAAVDALKQRIASPPEGIVMKVTGPAGFGADAIEVFGDINTTLLLATGTLVIALLLIIYRSPVFWVLPILAVAFAELTVRAVGYLLGSSGVVINGQTQGIALVLVFGAGTDYALLLVARYREELHHRATPGEALRVALGQAGPASSQAPEPSSPASWCSRSPR